MSCTLAHHGPFAAASEDQKKKKKGEEVVVEGSGSGESFGMTDHS